MIKIWNIQIKFVYLRKIVYMNEEFEIYYTEVLSYLDSTVLPIHLKKGIGEDLREYIYILFYKNINETTAATAVSGFLTIFKKYLN